MMHTLRVLLIHNKAIRAVVSKLCNLGGCWTWSTLDAWSRGPEFTIFKITQTVQHSILVRLML